MVKYILIVIIFISFNVNLYSQIDRSQYYSYGNSIFSELHELPYSNQDSIKLLCLFKASVESLLFEKVNEGINYGDYSSVFNVEILFRKNNGIIKKRINYLDTLLFDDYDKTTQKDLFIEGGKEITLKNDDYDVEVKFNIKEKSYLNKQEYSLKKDDNLKFNQIFVKENDANKRRDLVPFIYNNKVDFSSDGIRVLFPFKELMDSGNLSYKLNKRNNLADNSIYWDDEISYSGKIDLLENSIVKLNNYKSKVSLDITDSEHSNLLSFIIPKEKITPGNYILSIENDNHQIDTLELKVEWIDKPLSLKDLDYAVQLLYYITTEEEFEKLEDAEGSNKSKLFMEFWSKYDPTPQTPFNEALEQYYKRVDFAYFNYQTISEKDGAQTDRGKVYILNSSPSEVNEEFRDGKNVLIWKYDELNKEYVFELRGTADYRLVKVNEG